MAGLQEPKISKVSQAHERIEKLEDFNKLVLGVLIITVITLLVTVAGLVIDALRFKTTTYQSLVDKVILLNEKIEAQNKVNDQIKNLKERNPYLK